MAKGRFGGISGKQGRHLILVRPAGGATDVTRTTIRKRRDDYDEEPILPYRSSDATRIAADAYNLSDDIYVQSRRKDDELMRTVNDRLNALDLDLLCPDDTKGSVRRSLAKYRRSKEHEEAEQDWKYKSSMDANKLPSFPKEQYPDLTDAELSAYEMSFTRAPRSAPRVPIVEFVDQAGEYQVIRGSEVFEDGLTDKRSMLDRIEAKAALKSQRNLKPKPKQSKSLRGPNMANVEMLMTRSSQPESQLDTVPLRSTKVNFGAKPAPRSAGRLNDDQELTLHSAKYYNLMRPEKRLMVLEEPDMPLPSTYNRMRERVREVYDGLDRHKIMMDRYIQPDLKGDSTLDTRHRVEDRCNDMMRSSQPRRAASVGPSVSSQSKAPISEVRSHIRDVLCRTKKDPLYFH